MKIYSQKSLLLLNKYYIYFLNLLQIIIYY